MKKLNRIGSGIIAVVIMFLFSAYANAQSAADANAARKVRSETYNSDGSLKTTGQKPVAETSAPVASNSSELNDLRNLLSTTKASLQSAKSKQDEQQITALTARIAAIESRISQLATTENSKSTK